jgi:hypothetical protein
MYAVGDGDTGCTYHSEDTSITSVCQTRRSHELPQTQLPGPCLRGILQFNNMLLRPADTSALPLLSIVRVLHQGILLC